MEDTTYQGYDFKTLNEFCQKYGLKQFINKVSPKWKKKDPFASEVKVDKTNSLEGLNIKDKVGIALDYSDDDYSLCDIYGIALSDGERTFYIDIDDVKNNEKVLSLLENKEIKKYCFDYKAIKVALSRYGITIDGLFFDLLIASYILDSSSRNNPDFVMNLFGVDLGEKEDTISLLSSNNPSRTGKMACFPLLLEEKVLGELNKFGAVDLYRTLEIPLADTLANMEIEGFPLDANKLDEFGKEFKAKADVLAEEIYAMAGERFNLASPKQIADVLFNKMGLSSNRKMSTSFEALKDIADEHPIVNKILEYRKYFKLVSTYTEGLKVHIRNDGKIHAKFNQALTSTGRLSSSDPNLQNISVRDEEGKMIRKAFYYPDDNYSILSLDYSQIELRVLASLSKCQGLKEVFESGEDIHAATAKRVFGLNREPNSDERRKAKTVNFGIVYGISDWGLAEQLEIPPKEARRIITSFYESFPEIATFFQNIIAQAMKDGYVSTLTGRRRYLLELHDSNYQTREFAKRAAMNAPIQGTAADLIKIAMIKVANALKEGGYETKMVLQIHDELIFRVPEKEKDAVYKLVKDTMEHAMELDVPLLVDGGFGKDWYDAK